MDVARSTRGRGVIAMLALVLAAAAVWASVSLASGGSSGSGGPASVPAQSQNGGGDRSEPVSSSGTPDGGGSPSGSREDCPFKDGQSGGLSDQADPAV